MLLEPKFPLEKYGLTDFVAGKKPLLTKVHQKNRLGWCGERRNIVRRNALVRGSNI